MASSSSKVAAAAVPDAPRSPLAAQHRIEQRRQHLSSLTPPSSPSAPHSTVTEEASASPKTKGVTCSSPDSRPLSSGGVRSPQGGSRRDTLREVSSTSPPTTGSGEDIEVKKKQGVANTLVVVAPGVSKNNADIEIEAGGTVVQWVFRGTGGDNGDDDRCARGRSIGRPIDRSGHGDSGVKHHQEDGGLVEEAEAPSDTDLRCKNFTIILLSDKGDHHRVTHHTLSDDGCCEEIFDRPGRYTYYVCSGPLTSGCIVAKAPQRHHDYTVATTPTVPPTPPAASISEYDACNKMGMDFKDRARISPASPRSEGGDRCFTEPEELCSKQTSDSAFLSEYDQEKKIAQEFVVKDNGDLPDTEEVHFVSKETRASSSSTALGDQQLGERTLEEKRNERESSGMAELSPLPRCEGQETKSTCGDRTEPHSTFGGEGVPVLSSEVVHSSCLQVGREQSLRHGEKDDSSLLTVVLGPKYVQENSRHRGDVKRWQEGLACDINLSALVSKKEDREKHSHSQQLILARVRDIDMPIQEEKHKNYERVESTAGNQAPHAKDKCSEKGCKGDLYISSGSDAGELISSQTISPIISRRSKAIDDVPRPSSEVSVESQVQGADYKTGSCLSMAPDENVADCNSVLLTPSSTPTLWPPKHAEPFFARSDGNVGPNSVDSDDIPVGTWVDGDYSATFERLKEEEKRPTSPLTLFIPSPALPTSTSDGRIGGDSLLVATIPRSPPALRPKTAAPQKVEVLQRDYTGQEWQEISPLTSPAEARRPNGDFGAFSCSDEIGIMPRSVSENHAGGERGGSNEAIADSGSSESMQLVSVTDATEMPMAAAVALIEEEHKSGATTQTVVDAGCAAEKNDSASMPSVLYTSEIAATGGGRGVTGDDAPPRILPQGPRETGTAPAPPAYLTTPRPLVFSSVDIGVSKNSDGKCCDSDGESFSSVDVEPSGTMPCDSYGAASLPRLQSVGNANEGEGEVIQVVTIGDDPMQLFDPETVKVAGGTRVVWEKYSYTSNGAELENFNVRLGCPIVETGWQTEFIFSLSRSQPTFSHKFEREGRFVVSSEALSPGLDRKRGEVEVECAAGGIGSDSFSSSDYILSGSDSVISGIEQNTSATEGTKKRSNEDDDSLPSLSSMERSPSVPAKNNSSSSNSLTSDEEYGKFNHDSTVLSCIHVDGKAVIRQSSPALVLPDMAVLTTATITGQEMRVLEPKKIPLRRPRSLPPLLGAYERDHIGRRKLFDRPGWLQPDQLSVVEWSKGSSVISEADNLSVKQTPRRSSPTHISPTFSVYNYVGTSVTSPAIGVQEVSGGSINEHGLGCTLRDAGTDVSRETSSEPPVAENVHREEATMQSGEPFTDGPTTQATSFVPQEEGEREAPFTRETGGEREAPLTRDTGGEREAPLTRETETSRIIRCDGREKDFLRTESSQFLEDTGGLHSALRSSKSKKKKAKRKKKKAGGNIQGRGDEGTDGRAGADGIIINTCDAGDHGDNPALLLEEWAYVKLSRNSESMVGGGNGKMPSKTLIVGDQGFKPGKPLVVQAEAIVSIKTASVWPNGGMRHDQVRSISLVGSIANDKQTRRFFEGSNKLEDMPDENRLGKTISSRRPLKAVFRKPGDYWLVDHLANKRIKINVTAGQVAPVAAAGSAQTGKGENEDDTSLSQDVGSVKSLQGSGGANGGDAISRLKKKNKGRGKQGDAIAFSVDTRPRSMAMALLAEGDAEVGYFTPSSGGTHGPVSEARLKEKTETSENSFEDSARKSVLELAPSPPSLPPIRIIHEGEKLGLDEYARFDKYDAVHVVTVSHERGFEPAELKLGFAPGFGTLIVCELDIKQRVTSEVVCRHRLREAVEVDAQNVVSGAAWKGEESEASEMAKGLERVASGAASHAIVADSDTETLDPDVLAARLGPGILKKRNFILGRYGEYRLSYSNNPKCGLTVIVKPPRDDVDLVVSAVNHSGAGLEGMEKSSTSLDSHKDNPKDARNYCGVQAHGRDGVDGQLSDANARDGENLASVAIHSDEISSAKSDKTKVSSKDAGRSRLSDDRSSSKSAEVRQESAVPNNLAVARASESSLPLRDVTLGHDQDQGDFVQQRSHVKRTKRNKIRSERAEAAKAAAATASSMEMVVVGVEADPEATACGMTRWVEYSEVSPLPKSSDVKKVVPIVAKLRGSNPVLTDWHTTVALPYVDESPSSSLQATGEVVKVDTLTLTSNVFNQTLTAIEAGQSAAVVTSTIGSYFSSQSETAAMDIALTSSPGGSFRDAESTVAKPTNIRRRDEKGNTGTNIRSGSKSGSLTVAEAPAVTKTTTIRKMEATEFGREQESTAARYIILGNASMIESLPAGIAAKETVANSSALTVATGWGEPITGASWSHEGGTSDPNTPASPSIGCWSSLHATSEGSPSTSHHSRAPPRGVPPRRWGNHTTTFAQLHPPPSPPPKSQGQGWSAPFVADKTVQTDPSLKPAPPAAAPRNAVDDYDPPNGAECGGWDASHMGGNEAAWTGLAPGALGASRVVIAGSNLIPVVGIERGNLLKETRGACQNSYCHFPAEDVGGGVTDAPAVAVNSPPDLHSGVGQFAVENVGKEGKGCGRKDKAGASSIQPSTDTPKSDVDSRSRKISSNLVDPTPPSGSKIPPSLKKKKKKKGRTEKRAENAKKEVSVAAEGPTRKLDSSSVSEPPAKKYLATLVEEAPSSVETQALGGAESVSISRPTSISFGDFVPRKALTRETSNNPPSAAGDNLNGFEPYSSGRAIPEIGEAGGKVGTEYKTNTADGNGVQTICEPRELPGVDGSEGKGERDTAAALPEALTPAGAFLPPPGLGEEPFLPSLLHSRFAAETPNSNTAKGPGKPRVTSASVTGVAPPTSAPATKPTRDSIDGSSSSWGNWSTNISFKERSRRSRELKGICLPPEYRRDTRVLARPAAFPKASRLPGGGYYMPEDPDDSLPSPSAYEVEEAARMMKVYNDMMERLRTGGVDKELPNGHTPKIYDFTSG